MSIVFEAYTAPPHGTGRFPGLLPFVFGSDMDVYGIVTGLLPSASGSGYGVGDASVLGLLPAVEAFDGTSFAVVQMLSPQAYGASYAPPDVSFGLVQGPYVQPWAAGYFDVYASPTVDGLLPRAEGFDVDYAVVAGLLPTSFGSDVDPLAHSFVVAYQTAGWMAIQASGDDTHKYLNDVVLFTAATPSAQAVLMLLDSIAFHGVVAQQVHLHALLAAQVAFADVSFGAPAGILSDSIQFSDSNIALAMYLATLLDSFAVAAELTGTAAAFAFVFDTFEFDASLNVQQQILQALHDGIEFGITLYTGADTYTAWVMTPESRAMRSYSNYAFNSYAQFGGRLYGAKDDGIYVLEGDTDDGDSIHASVRSGLLDFGSRQLKRVERAYLGYTAEGSLALRVTTTSPEGKKIDYTYRMVTPPTAEAPRETRVQIGKGLQSVYWAFELDNSLDGGDFELHDVTVLPIILSRKVR